MRVELPAFAGLALVLQGCGSGKTPAPSPAPGPGPAPATAVACDSVFDACAEEDASDCRIPSTEDAGKYPGCNDQLKTLFADLKDKVAKEDLKGMNDYVAGGLAGTALKKATCLTALRYAHTSLKQACPMPLPPALKDLQTPKPSFSLFTLGDWGPTGNRPHCPYASKGCPDTCRMSMFANLDRIPDSCTTLFETNNDAQQHVADQMAKYAQTEEPVAVLNVGDNFYYGGISTPANFAAGVSTDITMDYAFNTTFRDVYLNNKNDPAGKLRVPFLGVFGNHDYGGAGCLSDWHVQTEFMKLDPTGLWVIPYQYYQQRVQAEGYFVDLFFNEINKDDCCAKDSHGICPQMLCQAPDYPTGIRADAGACEDRMSAVADRNLEWLEEALKKSKADGARWQIVVGHFSDGSQLGLVKEKMKLTGAQLYVGGHTHKQGYTAGDAPGSHGIPAIITGAGGGIEFELGSDYYGFGIVEVSKDLLTVKMISDTGKVKSTSHIAPDATTVLL